MVKTITQIRKEVREEIEGKKLKLKDKRNIRILISEGNKIMSSLELPYEENYVKIICEWMLKDVKVLPEEVQER